MAAAYRRLADRAIVVGRGRSGTFVLDRPSLVVPRAPVLPADAIDLASGSPDPSLLPDLGGYVRHDGPSTSYVDPVVLPDLEEAGRAWLDRQGLVADRLILTSGALDAIERVLAARLRPGDAVAVECPGWSALFDLIAALGLRSVPVDVDDRGMLPADLARHLSGVDGVVITPRAQNPYGAAVDGDRHRELRAVLDTRPEVLVVEDDHAGPVAGTTLYPVGPGRKRWAFVQSVAKALGPDLRLALMAGDDLTLDRVEGRFAAGPGWVSRILQSAVVRMMQDPDVWKLMEHAAEAYATRRNALIEQLTQAGIAAKGRSGLNVWARVTDESTAIGAAAAAGFVLRGGSAFGARHPAIRVTVSNLDLDSVPELVEAVAAGRSGRIV